VAAFPWDGAEVDVRTLTLAVAPQVTVPLSGAPLDPPQPAPRPEPEPERAPAPVAPIRPPAPTPDVPEPEPEPELPPAAAAPARAARAPRARRVTALEAKLETVTLERDAAQRARDSAEAALAAAQAQRDEARAQRDDVLLAYRALQREVGGERAQEDRAPEPAPEGATDPEDPSDARPTSATRAVMAEQRPAAPASGLPLSVLDLWVIRVLGTVAAGCVILLLISLLRVFI
jgi:colicin import membrane protein